jgi:FAD/FMN-containing dehydrogenase
VTDLAAIVGGQHVATDPDITAAHARDWTGRFVGTADVVVSPGTAEEVGAVAAACSAVGTPMVAQGGNTSLVAGGVPEAGQVVVDLRRLRQLAIDPVARVATADAGVTIAALQRAAAEHGLRYPVDLASRDTATVGGTIATNAGGLRVVRHGMTRAQLLGIAAVLADGSQVEHLPGFGRDNTGYHLPSLLCGSEGTLAFVTRAQLRLIPVLTDRVVALQRFPSLDEAVTAATALAADTRVEAVELMLRPGVELVCSVTGLAPPPAAAAYVLTESSSPDGLTDDALVALDPADAARLWAYRERHPRSGAQARRHAAAAAPRRVPHLDPRRGDEPLPRRRGLAVRSCRRRQRARQRDRRRPRRRRPHRSRAAGGRRPRRVHLQRARHRPGEGAVAAPGAFAGRAGAVPPAEVGIRPRRAAESRCPEGMMGTRPAGGGPR